MDVELNRQEYVEILNLVVFFLQVARDNNDEAEAIKLAKIITKMERRLLLPFES